GDKDAAGNVCVGNVVVEDVRGSYVRSDGPLTTVVGLDGVVVIVTGDAVLVAAKNRVQDIGGIVAGFPAEREADGAAEVTAPSPDQIRGPARRRRTGGRRREARKA
ncbi:MAG: hypothetical protein WEC41_06385, partial [Dongiaceae bacterium]